MKDFHPIREIATRLGWPTKENMLVAETALKQECKRREKLGGQGNPWVELDGYTTLYFLDGGGFTVEREETNYRWVVKIRKDEADLQICSVTKAERTQNQDWGKPRELTGRERLGLLEALVE